MARTLRDMSPTLPAARMPHSGLTGLLSASAAAEPAARGRSGPRGDEHEGPGQQPRPDHRHHRYQEDDEADPVSESRAAYMMLRLRERSGGEHEEDVHGRETRGRTASRGSAGRARASRDQARPGALERPDRREPQAGDDGERGRDEHHGEVAEQLGARCRRPDDASTGQSSEAYCSSAEIGSARWPSPSARSAPICPVGEQQHDIRQAAGAPERIDDEVQPERDAEPARRALVRGRARVVAGPERRRAHPDFSSMPGAHQHHQKESAEEVLPGQPRRDADGRPSGGAVPPGYSHEVGDRRQLPQPARYDDHDGEATIVMEQPGEPTQRNAREAGAVGFGTTHLRKRGQRMQADRSGAATTGVPKTTIGAVTRSGVLDLDGDRLASDAGTRQPSVCRWRRDDDPFSR